MRKRNGFNGIFTSESVTEGHPDKICDQIADAILDALLAQDPDSRCACEVTVRGGKVDIFGEITSWAIVDYEQIARNVIRRIGYTDPSLGFDADHARVVVDIAQQSADIAVGVDSKNAKRQGAGDQGIVFGYATNETDCLMPYPIVYATNETDCLMPYPIVAAHRIAKRLAEVRKSGEIVGLRPDGKTQVSVWYKDGKPLQVRQYVVSTQHDEDIDMNQLWEQIFGKVIFTAIPYNKGLAQLFVNPTGRFVKGGPAADSGLTGRKLIVDTYGGACRHGGGAFSGKDPSKVDRSGAYRARQIAKSIVANGYADRCEIQIGYIIGKADPCSVYVDTFGTEKIPFKKIIKKVNSVDMTPYGIIKELDLKRPIYSQTACYGHFGENAASLPWEQVLDI